MGVQFDDLEQFNSASFGLYYERIRDAYPIVEEHPRLNRMHDPTQPLPSPAGVILSTLDKLPLRAWFKNREEATKLIQLQQDRFTFNWTLEAEGEYPRYSANEAECIKRLSEFMRFCEEEGYGVIQPTVHEVVYVNRITPWEGESLIDLFAKVFPALQWTNATNFLPTPEMARFDRTYPIDGNRGRLYAEAGIAADSGGEQFVWLKMTARVVHPADSAVSSTDLSAIQSSLDLCHRWAVKGFECLTDLSVQKERWGKYE